MRGMEEKQIENTGAGGGQFVYETYKKGICIRKYRGVGENAVIPPVIDEKPVIAIERKAFLSCKTIREITLPDTVVEIGDWAFAHAEGLRFITIPHHALGRGKELFLGCKRLREIILDGSDAEKALRSSQGLGQKLMALVPLDDLDGFEELWTCGEEDYEGKDYDIKSYPVEKRKMKLRIVYFRLLHPYKIAEDTHTALKTYLGRHTKGTDAPQAWELILEEHKNDLDYYRIFAEAGGVTEENFDGLLADMDGVSAEIKAYMLRYQEEHISRKDAFAAFTLDW